MGIVAVLLFFCSAAVLQCWCSREESTSNVAVLGCEGQKAASLSMQRKPRFANTADQISVGSRTAAQHPNAHCAASIYQYQFLSVLTGVRWVSLQTSSSTTRSWPSSPWPLEQLQQQQQAQHTSDSNVSGLLTLWYVPH